MRNICDRTRTSYEEMYSTHRLASSIKIKFSLSSAAQAALKAYRDNSDKWVVTTDACQYPMRLTVERTADDPPTARLPLRTAWLLRLTGLEGGAQADISTGRTSTLTTRSSVTSAGRRPSTLDASRARPGTHFGARMAEGVAGRCHELGQRKRLLARITCWSSCRMSITDMLHAMTIINSARAHAHAQHEQVHSCRYNAEILDARVRRVRGGGADLPCRDAHSQNPRAWS